MQSYPDDNEKSELIKKIEELEKDEITLRDILENCADDILADVQFELVRVIRELKSNRQALEEFNEGESNQSLTKQQTVEEFPVFEESECSSTEAEDGSSSGSSLEESVDKALIDDIHKLLVEYERSYTSTVTIAPSNEEIKRKKIENRQSVEEMKKRQREIENKKREEEIEREKEINNSSEKENKKREEELERERQVNNSDPIIKLNAIINLFANNPENTTKKNHTEFCNALNELKKDLIKTLQKNKSGTTALVFAKATFEMLNALQNPNSSIEDRLTVVTNYENQCKNANGWEKLFKALAVICFAAVGFIVGAVIGAAIGIAAGAWMGPGAFVTAALGFITGAVAGTSAMIGVTAGATATGFGVAIGAGFLMFQPRGLHKRTADVAELGKCYVDPDTYQVSKRVRVK